MAKKKKIESWLNLLTQGFPPLEGKEAKIFIEEMMSCKPVSKKEIMKAKKIYDTIMKNSKGL